MRAATDGLFVEILEAYSNSSKSGVRFSLPHEECVAKVSPLHLGFSVFVGAEMALHVLLTCQSPQQWCQTS